MKFRPRERRRDVSIDLTPLIDVVFILLIFFMVSTTFTKESRLGLVLPEASQGQPAEERPESLEITVNDQGGYGVNGQALVNERPETLQLAIEKMLGDARDLPVILHGDARAPHEAVVRALDVLGRLGFSEISIATRQPEAAATP